MTTLRALQRELQAYLLGRPNAAVACVADSARLPAEARLRVYAEAYRLRLRDALESDFIALRAWLGRERFTCIADAYIAARPSTHYSLRWFGRDFAGFLADDARWAATPLLAELAALDWALVGAFDAADDPVLEREHLARVAAADWPGLTFRVHASVMRLDLCWNAASIRKAAERGETLPAAEHAPAVAWVVWRQGLETYFRSLEPDEAWAFDALRRGAEFSEICDGLCRWTEPERVAARASALLRRWIDDEMLCRR